MTKMFVWKRRCGVSNAPTKGPYWSGPLNSGWQIHGRKMYWTLDQLLDLPFSKTIKKRLKGLRVGTELTVYSTGRNSSESLTRLSDEQVMLIAKARSLQVDLELIRDEIEQAIPELLERKRAAEKAVRDHKKKMNKEGLK
nr:hypothetical protein 2 [bacterium]